MLNSAKIIGFIPVRDLDRAKQFFAGTLELRATGEDGFAVTFDANGTMVRVVKVTNHQPAPFTIMGWEVENIRPAVQHLQQRGVRFERFDGMQQDDLGIWTSPGGSKVAWFKDCDGNVLSLSQLV